MKHLQILLLISITIMNNIVSMEQSNPISNESLIKSSIDHRDKLLEQAFKDDFHSYNYGKEKGPDFEERCQDYVNEMMMIRSLDRMSRDNATINFETALKDNNKEEMSKALEKYLNAQKKLDMSANLPIIVKIEGEEDHIINTELKKGSFEWAQIMVGKWIGTNKFNITTKQTNDLLVNIGEYSKRKKLIELKSSYSDACKKNDESEKKKIEENFLEIHIENDIPLIKNPIIVKQNNKMRRVHPFINKHSNKDQYIEGVLKLLKEPSTQTQEPTSHSKKRSLSNENIDDMDTLPTNTNKHQKK